MLSAPEHATAATAAGHSQRLLPSEVFRAPVRLLNVHGDDAERHAVSDLLRAADFIVDEAATGEAAIAAARVTQPLLMVLDVRLPDIDGMEVCRRLRADPATAAILVLHTSAPAAQAATESKIRGLEVGGDAFLQQPFASQELIATVNSLVRLKRVEEVQRRRADELAALDRRKDEFLAMLGHELRNPLAAIATAQAVIDRQPAATPAEERARDVIRRQLVHVTRLVDDLLDMSRVTQGKINVTLEPLELGPLLREVGEVVMASTLGARQQRLVLRLAREPVIILGDRARIEQIVTNLVDNASKYSEPGTEIILGLAIAAQDGARVAAVTVRDQGMGIAPDALPQLFGLFFQANPSIARSSGGLGIGLSLVHGLAQLHGGSVAARSAGLGQGSELEVRLPLHEASMTAKPTPTPEPVRPASTARRVLIVDDNDDARDMLASLCEIWGHEVDTAADGLSAVERALGGTPDIALIDIGLPGIDGHEVARRIRADARGQGMMLVALTGYSSPEERAECARAGFDLHLVKPAPTARIAEVISSVPARPSVPPR